jgi:hypothetical protein
MALAVTIANMKQRPFHGHENWLHWSELRDELRNMGSRIDQLRGFQLVPPIIPATMPVLRRVDRLGGVLGPLMVNLAVCARK